MSVCSSLVDDTVVEESHQVAGETLLEEVDAHSVKEELSQRLKERVLLEVVDNETLLVIHNTYRYHSNYQHNNNKITDFVNFVGTVL